MKTRMLLSLTLCCAAASPVAAYSIYYVTESGAGTQLGSSWANAFPGLHAALTSNTSWQSGDQIWVAAGTYATSTYTVSFNLIDGVEIYGGFAGSESSLSQRHWFQNNTILSGIHTGNRALHVVKATGVGSSTIVDGFIVRDGHADETGYDAFGGGVFIDHASPVIRNCRFFGNNAGPESGDSVARGGAAYVGWSGEDHNSNPKFENCVFSDQTSSATTNFVHGVGGAAVYVEYDCKPVFVNCLFVYNGVSSGGDNLGNGGTVLNRGQSTFLRPAINR